MMNHNTYDRLENIKAKTLIMYGRNDKVQFPVASKTLAEKIPDSELYVVDNAAHNVLEEQWEEIYPKILDFLR